MSGAADTNNTNSNQTPPANTTGSQNQNLQQDADDPSWDPRTRDYVSNLRNEAKNRRLEAQTLRQRITELETSQNQLMARIRGNSQGTGEQNADQMSPEDYIERLTHSHQELQAELAFVRSAASLGITDERDQRYFQFLLNEHMEDQDEGYEIPPEVLSEIVRDVQSRSVAQQNRQKSSTSFNQGPAPAPDGSSSDITVEQFRAMGTIAKSQLYGKNPELYNKLNQLSRN
jgi:hypothetical protein